MECISFSIKIPVDDPDYLGSFSFGDPDSFLPFSKCSFHFMVQGSYSSSHDQVHILASENSREAEVHTFFLRA